jgi:hypothetical protein
MAVSWSGLLSWNFKYLCPDVSDEKARMIADLAVRSLAASTSEE